MQTNVTNIVATRTEVSTYSTRCYFKINMRILSKKNLWKTVGLCLQNKALF